jgi:hypothetical protein
MNGKSKFVLLAIPALLLAACSSGPAFTDAPQANAAILEGPVVADPGAENGNCSIMVAQVDGLSSDFTASHAGPNWHESGKVKPLLLAPAYHKLELNISYAESFAKGGGSGIRSPSPQGMEDQGSTRGFGESKATTIAEVFADFEAGHVYRLTADLEDEMISVVLWDETNGAQGRERVRDWSFNCPRPRAGGTGPNGQVR